MSTLITHELGHAIAYWACNVPSIIGINHTTSFKEEINPDLRKMMQGYESSDYSAPLPKIYINLIPNFNNACFFSAFMDSKLSPVQRIICSAAGPISAIVCNLILYKLVSDEYLRSLFLSQAKNEPLNFLPTIGSDGSKIFKAVGVTPEFIEKHTGITPQKLELTDYLKYPVYVLFAYITKTGKIALLYK